MCSNVALAIRCAAAVPAAVTLSEGEGVGIPLLRVTGGDHVVVGVEEHLGGALLAGARAHEGERAVGGFVGGHVHAELLKCFLNPGCGLAVTGLATGAVEGDELLQVGKDAVFLLVDGIANCLCFYFQCHAVNRSQPHHELLPKVQRNVYSLGQCFALGAKEC